ncbi:MAG: glutathione S-transferase [Sphingomonadales bacterium]|jgi:glutathione S-transferase|nr:glutathione S-transferase [Sphingomonadales bacterium]
MTLTLYFHPFSSYCQKVLIALYERDLPFAPRIVDLSDSAERAMLEALSPIGKFPVLRDDEAGRTIAEASVIVEYLDHLGDAPPLIPAGRDAALDVRYWDRVFDLYVMTPLQKAVADTFRPDGTHDSFGVEDAKANLERSYRIVDDALARRGNDWICGDSFTLADCAAAPALFYAGMVVSFDAHPRLSAYFTRLRARPSFSRAVDEARPYRAFFPLGWREGYD